MSLCECGCGQPTKICYHTSTRGGRIKGQSNRFLRGHSGIKPRALADETMLEPGTKAIPLSNGMFAFVDESDYEELARYNWRAGRDPERPYAERGASIGHGKERTIKMHRQILNAPDGVEVDHIDGDVLNNRRSNLRLATSSQNNYNRGPQRSNSSGYKGVHWEKKDRKWRARISFGGKRLYLGSFADIEEAARAYDAAALELHGEFARPNFPEQEAQS